MLATEVQAETAESTRGGDAKPDNHEVKPRSIDAAAATRTRRRVHSADGEDAREAFGN